MDHTLLSLSIKVFDSLSLFVSLSLSVSLSGPPSLPLPTPHPLPSSPLLSFSLPHSYQRMKCSCQAANKTDTTIALCLGLELLPALLCVRKYCRVFYWRLFVLSGHRKEAGGVLRAVGKPIPRVCWQNHRNGSIPIYHRCWTGQYRVIVTFSPFTVADTMCLFARLFSSSRF